MSRIYNKLVRDKISDIIKSKGENCKFEVLNDEDYKDFLDKKLNEEVAEYQSSKSLAELVDIIEVIYAIAKTRGFYTRTDGRIAYSEKGIKRWFQ